MSRTELRKIVGNISILFMLVVCLIFITDSNLFGLGKVIGQSNNKVITYSKWKNQPVEISTVKAAGKDISLQAARPQAEYKEEVEGNDDWLNGLVLHLVNTSNKNIIYIKVSLLFPEIVIDGSNLSHPIHFGHYPYVVDDGNVQPLVAGNEVLKPGEETDLILPDDQYVGLNKFMQHYNYSIVNSVHMALQFVIFDDDTAWSGGNLMQRNPADLKSWIKITAQ